jgi:hypothetical protein
MNINFNLQSPTKSIGCSAKKRWLRAAMSEDHSEDGVGAGGASPEPDCTPLKKRRLATYKEAAEPTDKQEKDAEQVKMQLVHRSGYNQVDRDKVNQLVAFSCSFITEETAAISRN